MTALAVARVHDFGGEAAVAEMLRRAGSRRTAAYLSDVGNWVSYDEALALLAAGARVTQHPQFARAVGEDAARRLNASPVAALLRSLGSPENVFGRIAETSVKYSVVTRLEAIDSGPGWVEIVATAEDGFPRSADHCAWTCGLLSQPTVLFGLPPATVHHDRCAALGAPACHYIVSWDQRVSDEAAVAAELTSLRGQLAAMQQRLNGVFAAAGDLISADEIGEALGRITDRAALEVRAPQYLLSVQLAEGGERLCHHRGLTDEEAAACVELLEEREPETLAEHWLAVPVRSRRRDYGRLLAMHAPGRRFFDQERELLEVYATYAAGALDSATALIDAKLRYAQSSALLALARQLAVAGTSQEVARNLAQAVPGVVACDRVEVHLSAGGQLALAAWRDLTDGDGRSRPAPPVADSVSSRLLGRVREPVVIAAGSGPAALRARFLSPGVEAAVLVPLASPESLLGLLVVSVTHDRHRLTLNGDLLDRLSGIAAQASTALLNGRLMDEITHQALHDPLTGLANRLRFHEVLEQATERAAHGDAEVTLFYVDLDAFKPINDSRGHDTGDRLLIAVADRLRACTRAEDVVARLGGDEFAVVMSAPVGSRDADGFAARLSLALEAPFYIDGEPLQIGASIGRADHSRTVAGVAELLRHADQAMFADKRARRSATLTSAS